MTKTPKTPRKDLDQIAASIKKLTLYLENSEIEGRSLTATEIDAVANKLQTHVEELLAASQSLREN